jgi:O-acetylserine/cysteine efflux transporter
MMKPHHFMLIMLCCLIWAGSFILGKMGVDTFPPLLFATLRYSLLLALLFPFLRFYQGQMRYVLAIGLLQGALHIGFFYMGVNILENMSVVAIAVQMEVPFAMALSIVILGERVGWRRMTGFLLCVSGMMVMSFDRAVFDYQTGIVFILLSSFLGALATIFMRQLKNIPVLHLQAWVALLSAPLLLLGTLLFESQQMEIIKSASLGAWSSVLYASLAATLIAYGLFYYLVQRYEVSMLSVLTSFVPVFGVILTTTIRGDALTEAMIVGGLAIIIGAIVIIERSKPKVEEIVL